MAEPLFHPDLLAKANGNGPVHLVLPDESLTLCGRSRFMTHRRSPSGWSPWGAADCKYCLALANPQRPSRRGRQELDAAGLDRLDAALKELREARADIAEVLTGAWWPEPHSADRVRLSRWLNAANAVGYSYAEVAGLIGCGRERVRQIALESA